MGVGNYIENLRMFLLLQDASLCHEKYFSIGSSQCMN